MLKSFSFRGLCPLTPARDITPGPPRGATEGPQALTFQLTFPFLIPMPANKDTMRMRMPSVLDFSMHHQCFFSKSSFLSPPPASPKPHSEIVVTLVTKSCKIRLLQHKPNKHLFVGKNGNMNNKKMSLTLSQRLHAHTHTHTQCTHTHNVHTHTHTHTCTHKHTHAGRRHTNSAAERNRWLPLSNSYLSSSYTRAVSILRRQRKLNGCCVRGFQTEMTIRDWNNCR